jgi:RepB DNA-primase from phage plasmid
MTARPLLLVATRADGTVIPSGCQTRINFETGATETRLALKPNLADAERFLTLLDPEAESFTFQTFDDGPKKSRSLAKTMPGPLDQCADPLRTLQAAGAGVFVTINHTAGGRRRAEDVDRIRAVFADLDGAPLDPVMACDLEPHVVVESSPGKFHVYWLVDGLPLDKFTLIQKAIARRFGGDPVVTDLPRVMRLPGFWHQKAEPPFQTRISSTLPRKRSRPSSRYRRPRRATATTPPLATATPTTPKPRPWRR